MKRIVVFLLGLSLVACSQPQPKDQVSGSNQPTALSASEPISTVPTEASGAGAGSAAGSPTALDSTKDNGAKTATTAAATSGQKSSSDNTNRSLTWLFGTVGVMIGVVVAADALTGGQAVGLFGEKKYPNEQKKPEAPASTLQQQEATSQTIVPPATGGAKTEECALPASVSPAPSATIQSAQDVVKFAESPKTP
jgi:hypothetical protein